MPLLPLGRENLCDGARFTGYDRDGGYAELHDRRRALLPSRCRRPRRRAGGAAALRGADRLPRTAPHGDAERLGLYGFGASAHIVCQVARPPGTARLRLHPRRGRGGAGFARALGAEWAGGSGEAPPEPLDAAIIFAPVGELVPAALRASRKGGDGRLRRHPHERHPRLPLRAALGRARVRSVANLTRRDGEEFLALAPQVPVRTEVVTHPLREANQALEALRSGSLRGAAVLTDG